MKLKLKIYRGFASDKKLYISGHVFKKNDPSYYSVESGWFKSIYYMWRTFSIKTIENIDLTLQFKGLESTAVSNENGFFKFELSHDLDIPDGWHGFTVSLNHFNKSIEATGELVKAAPGPGIISDIDDTFLISHSSSILRKIYILLTRNINRRKFFVGVLKHYQLLAQVERPVSQPALFFYVSSSEWNLYNFIEKFTILHGFPKAVLFLKTIKSGIFDLLSSGGGNHQHKQDRIEFILNFYPERQFILLGDDTQQDPFIYTYIAEHFPNQLLAVYIRQVSTDPKSQVSDTLRIVEQNGVPVCYFKNSSVAMKHSKDIGLV
ncbi:App1 family protein [Nonlabens marinus]|uniref:Phosphatidate phosphatase APP1 catalytic domain-containing protein n=1 Tax=Nonlabens marinus S1-08 TaxID=1454201 RepID=W8VXL6_9FLAO|nr:App1 family protein [Nonlabens marinus]BAO56142.1 hypothetical protein NMS_2133 [Nonlabens marinus S1-08]